MVELRAVLPEYELTDDNLIAAANAYIDRQKEFAVDPLLDCDIPF